MPDSEHLVDPFQDRSGNAVPVPFERAGEIASELARLHQHLRECLGHGAQGLPQRQILALALNVPAMGRRRHAGSVQGFPLIEGKKASASSSRCSCKARPTAAFRRNACSNRRGCVNFNAQRPLREFQQTRGHPPNKSSTSRRLKRELEVEIACCMISGAKRYPL